MKVTVSFAAPVPATLTTTSLLLIGWAIGAHWGHNLAAGCVLLIAMVLMLLHDVVLAVFLAMAAAKLSSSGGK